MSPDNFVPRRTFPRNTNNRGETHAPPTRPIPDKRILPEGTTLFQTNGHGLPKDSATVVITEAGIRSDPYRGEVKGFAVTPIKQEPLTPPFHTSVGGGRVGGGGTSIEAIRRAKRKAHNPHR